MKKYSVVFFSILGDFPGLLFVYTYIEVCVHPTIF